MPITKEQYQAELQRRMTAGELSQGDIQSAGQPSMGQRLQGGVQGVLGALQQVGGITPQKAAATGDINELQKILLKEQLERNRPLSAGEQQIQNFTTQALTPGQGGEQTGGGLRPSVSQISGGKPTIEFDTQSDRLTRATGLRKEFQALPVVKQFNVIRRQSAGIDAALDDALAAKTDKGKGIADQALIVGFNKVIDPESVVRQSEFARTPEGLSFVNRVRGFVDRMRQGSVGITDDERRDIARVADLLVNAAGEEFNLELDRFEQLSKDFSVDSKRVIGGVRRFKPKTEQVPIAPTQQLGGGGGDLDSQINSFLDSVEGQLR